MAVCAAAHGVGVAVAAEYLVEVVVLGAVFAPAAARGDVGELGQAGNFDAPGLVVKGVEVQAVEAGDGHELEDDAHVRGGLVVAGDVDVEAAPLVVGPVLDADVGNIRRFVAGDGHGNHEAEEGLSAVLGTAGDDKAVVAEVDGVVFGVLGSDVDKDRLSVGDVACAGHQGHLLIGGGNVVEAGLPVGGAGLVEVVDTGAVGHAVALAAGP